MRKEKYINNELDLFSTISCVCSYTDLNTTTQEPHGTTTINFCIINLKWLIIQLIVEIYGISIMKLPNHTLIK